MRQFSIIVSMDSERGIGKKGTIPWHLPRDRKHFRKITCTCQAPSKKNALFMGRKTWESIPEKYKPLTGRLNVVLTHSATPQNAGSLSVSTLREKKIENPDVLSGSLGYSEGLTRSGDLMLSDGVLKAGSINEALTILGGQPYNEGIDQVFCIGGGEVYRQALQNPDCQKIYATHILAKFNCDTFFPAFQDRFKKESVSDNCIKNGTEFYFATYKREP